MLVHLIQSTCWLYLTLVFCSISLRYICYSTTASWLHLYLHSYVCECYTYGYCDMFLYIIRSDRQLLYILGILSCILPIYFFHSNFFPLVALHSQKWINTMLFELVSTCIKTHIFVSTLSISHIFISIFLLFITLRADLHLKYPTLYNTHKTSSLHYL